MFVDEVMRFLLFTIQSETANRLWRDSPDLRQMAMQTYEGELIHAAKVLRAAIAEIPEQKLREHGLIGIAALFKYSVMVTVSRGWGKMRKHFTVRGGFRKVVEAVDAHLDSLIEAAGVGGVIKEFKDALLALAPER